MKNQNKFVAVLAFAAAFLFSLPSFSQSKVYIDENFEQFLDTAHFNHTWDASSSKWDMMYLITIDDLMGGWAYDPQGQIFGAGNGISDKVVGEHGLQSLPFRVTEQGDFVLRMDICYVAYDSSDSRNLFILLQEKGAETWDTVWRLREEGQTILRAPITQSAIGRSYRIDTNFQSKYNGKEMVFRIAYYNKFSATDAFLALVGNIEVRSFAPSANVDLAITTYPYLYGEKFTLSGVCENTGTVDVASVQYAYAINGTYVGTAEVLTFAPGLNSYGEKVNVNLEVNMTGSVLRETNTITFWPAKINGENPAFVDTARYTYVYLDEAVVTQQFVPLMECFTSATCPPCRTMNEYLNPVLEDLHKAGKISVIKYQMNFPGAGDKYYIGANGARSNYYGGISSVPTPIYNGQDNIFNWPVATYSEMMNKLRSNVEFDVSKKALMSVDIKNAYVDAEKKLSVELEITSALDKQATVHTAVVEKTTTGNKGSNGEKEFHWVNMRMLPSGMGDAKTFVAGQPLTLRYNSSLVPGMVACNIEEMTDLELVVFVQDPATGYIYQSASMDVAYDPVLAANEERALAGVGIYPNPAREKAVFSGLENAGLQVMDLTGRVVYSVEGVSGNHELALGEFTTGTYMVRIAQNGVVATRKLVVVK